MYPPRILHSTHQSSPLCNELSSSPVPDLYRPEAAIWTCCQCHTVNQLSLYPGQHPLGTVSCVCPHRPCEDCHFTGVSYFLPISEPGVVPLSSPQTPSSPAPNLESLAQSDIEIPFGIICSACGLSWRVEESAIQEGWLQKLPNMHNKMRSLRKHKLTPSAGKLRKTRSLIMLGLGTRSSDKVSDGEQKVEPAVFSTVTFSGLKCSCGHVSSLDSFCFRVMGSERSSSALEGKFPAKTVTPMRVPVRVNGVGRKTDEELMSKGHDDTMIRIRGHQHPHPLRSMPVSANDLL